VRNLHYEKFADGTVKCIEDEIPFEVPEGWEWSRLKHICTMAAGKAKPTNDIKPEPFDGCYPCFGGNGIRGYVDEYNQDGTYSIVGRQGALCGNINIASGKFYATEHAVVTTLFSGIDFIWSNHTLEALELNKYATGAAQPGLSVANVLNALVPVPPTCEQKRIGRIVSSAIELTEGVALEKQELQSIIIQAKARILDLAIRGKLVPQSPDDEPASVLLDRIRAEKEELIKQGKIKRDKRESVIFRGEDNSYYEKVRNKFICIDDDLPFDIPDGWAWCELQDCCCKEIKRGRSPKYADTGTVRSFAQKCNQKSGGINISLAQWIDDSSIGRYDEDEYMLDGDIVINSTGTGTLGRVGIYYDSDNRERTPIVPDSHVTVVRTSRLFNSSYIFLCLKAMQSRLEELGEGSTNQKELKPLTIQQQRIPVPPLVEQQAIVKRVCAFFEELDYVEANLC